MTTVLSVTTPPIVWPKKRAFAASGTIIKEQEWAVHIKQHNIPCGPTCMGPAKGGKSEERQRRERGRSKRSGRGAGRVAERDGWRRRKIAPEKKPRRGDNCKTQTFVLCFLRG